MKGELLRAKQHLLSISAGRQRSNCNYAILYKNSLEAKHVKVTASVKEPLLFKPIIFLWFLKTRALGFSACVWNPNAVRTPSFRVMISTLPCDWISLCSSLSQSKLSQFAKTHEHNKQNTSTQKTWGKTEWEKEKIDLWYLEKPGYEF